jgi:hypothetical protein
MLLCCANGSQQQDSKVMCCESNQWYNRTGTNSTGCLAADHTATMN